MIPAWHSGKAWFDAVMDMLNTPEGEALRARAKVAVGTVLKVARADWASADASTGRGVSTAHASVALQLGVSGKTVQRSRKLLEALGLAVTVIEGRYLTIAERKAAHALHGGHQIKAASLRALSMPRSVVENVQLPSGTNFAEITYELKVKTRRLRARKASPTNKRTQTKPDDRLDFRSEPTRKPRPIELQKLAGELAIMIPWLSRGRHVGNVSSMLERCKIDPARWTARALIDVVNRKNVETGLVVTSAADQRDPISYLAWQILSAVDPAAPTPVEEQAIRAAEREARRAELQVGRENERQRIDAIDQDEVARIIAQMKADLVSRGRK